MNKLGMVKTLTLASLSVVVFAASIALAQRHRLSRAKKLIPMGGMVRRVIAAGGAVVTVWVA